MRKVLRWLALFCACCTAVGFCGCNDEKKPEDKKIDFYTTDTVSWETEESVGLRFAYSADGTYYTLRDIGTCTEDKVVIPAYVGDTPVKAIAYNAFAACEQIKEVVIPDTVTSISFMAFTACPNLERVKIGEGLETIENATFYNCSKLSVVSLSSSLKKIDAEAFKNCTSLENLVIPESVEEIGLRAFGGCSALKNVLLPKSLQKIGDYAFEDCSNIKNVFYAATSEEFKRIKIGSGNEPLTRQSRYYYAEQAPETDGNFWYVKENQVTIWS